MDKDTKKATLEAVLFAMGESVELSKLAEVIEEDNNVIGKILTTYDGEIIDYVNGEKHLINTNRKDMPNSLSLPCLFINVIIHSAIRAIKAIKHTIPHTIENGYAIGYIE